MGAVAYCPQDAFLFSGTIGENIAFGEVRRDDSALQRAAHIAALDEDLAGFPDGFQTQVGERGVQVSGGQRQRIALARAIYSGKKLLVLDAPFSSVDMATERRIIERMRTHLKDTAILLLSHRLAAFPEADLVMVLDQGRVVEQGTHAQLMRSGSTYPAIYRAQLRIEGGA
jgi:ABC-type multidrug transport system fused ATPase/permease subunit